MIRIARGKRPIKRILPAPEESIPQVRFHAPCMWKSEPTANNEKMITMTMYGIVIAA